MNCTCPLPVSLTAIVAQACGVDMGQIQKMAFQRTQATPSFTAATILLLATWQPLIAANDNTKIVVTPFIGGDPIIEAGEAITTGGGDNSTLNGVEEITGVNPSVFSTTFNSLPPSTEKQLKALMCEKALTVYFFLEGGRIVSKEITNTPANDEVGLPVQSLFVSDRNNAGFGNKDTNSMRFSLLKGWSEDIAIFTPTDFNPLLDL